MKLKKTEGNFFGTLKRKLGDALGKLEGGMHPKEVGGQGVRKIRETNKVLLSKWLWRFWNEEGNLWHRVIVEKYG